MRFWTVVMLSALALAGCNKPRQAYSEAAVDMAAAAPPGATAKPPPLASVPAGAVPMLAYTYDYDLVAPAKAVPELMTQDQKACADAGPQVCQVVGSSVTQGDDNVVTAKLQIQARPDWLATLRGKLAGEAKAAGGRVAGSTVESEDLTRQIVDTEAAVRAKTTLRDRLQAMLASRPGKLSDLLEVEKALAQVQGELDATQSELAVMRTRVATSQMTITYGSTPSVLAPRGAWAPLTEAVRGSAGALAATLAVMLTTVVAGGPWLIVAAAVALVVRRFLPRKPKPPTKS